MEKEDLVKLSENRDDELSNNEQKGDDVVGEEDIANNLLSIKMITRLQAYYRRYQTRKQCVSLLQTKYEKIYDPKKKRYFYYDIVRDISSWRKPKLLKDSDIVKISSLYSNEDAAIMIQKQIRRLFALMRVRMLYQKRIKIHVKHRKTTYYNKVTKTTVTNLPNFMQGKLNYDYEINLHENDDDGDDDDGNVKGNKNKKNKSQKKNKKQNESESDGSDEDEGPEDDQPDNQEEDDKSTDSDSSSVIRAKRIAGRVHPRSKAQSLIDACEDRTDKKASLELNLSGIGASRFSSRIYDLSHLRRLILSNNKLKKISSEIKYLMNLELLDVRKNLLRHLPVELEELKNLRTLLIGHNKIKTYPGCFYKLSGMRTLDLSYNRFPSIPVEIGNMELLKLLHEWEVGIGLYQLLQELNVSYCKLTEWPNHIDKIPSLQLLNFAGNQFETIPKAIGVHTTLKYLDLSENKLLVFPIDFYSLTQLQTLIIHHNGFYQLPDQKNRPRIASLSVIDFSYNKFTTFDGTFNVFPKLLNINLSYNDLHDIQPSIGQLTFLQILNFNCNKIPFLPDKLGACVALHTLLVSHNQLLEFPSCIPHLLNLKYLDLSFNQLQSTRPTYFSTLLKLIEVNLANNSITTLPNSIYTLNKLIKLNLSNNEITSLSEELISKLSSLQYFDISYNKLTSLPVDISHLFSLIELNLRNNNLSSLPESMASMSQLRSLSLVNNSFEDFPLVLHKMKNLKNWNLNNNKIRGYYGEFLENMNEERREEERDQEMERGGEGERGEGEKGEVEGNQQEEEERTRKRGRSIPANEEKKSTEKIIGIETIKRKNRKLIVELEHEIFKRHSKSDHLMITQSIPDKTDRGYEQLKQFYRDLQESILYLQEADYTSLPQLTDPGYGMKSFWRTLIRSSISIDRCTSTSIGCTPLQSPSHLEPLPSALFPANILEHLNFGKDFIQFIQKYERLSKKIQKYNQTTRADQILLSQTGQMKALQTSMTLTQQHNNHKHQTRKILTHEESLNEEFEQAMDHQVDSLINQSRKHKQSFRLTLSIKGEENNLKKEFELLKKKYPTHHEDNEESVEEQSLNNDSHGSESGGVNKSQSVRSGQESLKSQSINQIPIIPHHATQDGGGGGSDVGGDGDEINHQVTNASLRSNNSSQHQTTPPLPTLPTLPPLPTPSHSQTHTTTTTAAAAAAVSNIDHSATSQHSQVSHSIPLSDHTHTPRLSISSVNQPSSLDNLPKIKQSKYSWKFNSLLFDPFLGNPKDSQLYYQVIESYYGLSLALLEIGECLAADIRKIEKSKNLQSKLNLNHRRGIDLMDLMPGYDHYFPRLDHQESRRGGGGGSGGGEEEQGQETKEMKRSFESSAFFSMSELDLGGDLESGNNSRPTTTEGGGRPTTMEGGSGSRPSTVQFDTPSLGNRRNSLTGSRRKSMSSHSEHNLIQETSPFHSFTTQQLNKMRSHLAQLHRHVYIWSSIILTCVSDLLHCVGWDPISLSSMEILDNIILITAKDLRSLVTGIYIAYSRSLSGLDLYDLSLNQLTRALHLSPMNRSTHIMKIKSLCCQGSYHQAKQCLTALIHQELYSNDPLTQESYRQLTIVHQDGYGNPFQQRIYSSDVNDNGLLHQPNHCKNINQHGNTTKTKQILENRQEIIVNQISQQREKENRHEYKNKKQASVMRARHVIEMNREMMTNFGPVIIS